MTDKYTRRGEGGTLLYALYRYVRPQRVWCLAVLVINRVSILAILVINRVWFLGSSLQLGTVFESFKFKASTVLEEA